VSGEIEHRDFKQVMQIIESARIQTVASAVGVAQPTLDEWMRCTQDRKQFGNALSNFTVG